MGAKLQCDRKVMAASDYKPLDVNHVRPGDIRIIAGMGDSYMIGTLSKNTADDMVNVFPGNSFTTGSDEKLEKHITLANILKEFNPFLIGASHGAGYHNTGFNVAICRNKSEDLPRQAKELVSRIRKKGEYLLGEWKLIIIVVGTYDLARLTCQLPLVKRPTMPFQFKQNLEKALSILQQKLPRTIISIIPMWNANAFIGARYEALNCGLTEYLKAANGLLAQAVYEIQAEQQLERNDFAITVQGFMDRMNDAFRLRNGSLNKSMYASNYFHLSKYGNAALAKLLWNSLFEGSCKETFYNNSIDISSLELKCPTKQ
ncbi:GDSL-like protein [Oesophagostomum dentatum]|uniref:GDSL-like protein n=1 Tax=Oesophagostomum dentatum TaxID=61180 RepID=A0A0B1TKD4_OESDE|nr:GDSL-like protein [Oesophagostomum dentatum]